MRAFAMPTTTGPTASRWEGLAARSTRSGLPAGLLNFPLIPRWYLTSPEPCTASGSMAPSNSRKSCP